MRNFLRSVQAGRDDVTRGSTGYTVIEFHLSTCSSPPQRARDGSLLLRLLAHLIPADQLEAGRQPV